MMLIGFSKDTMIRPWNTSLFGFYKDENQNSYNDLENEAVYDRLGLRSLHESGKLIRCVLSNNHL